MVTNVKRASALKYGSKSNSVTEYNYMTISLPTKAESQ